MKPKYSLSLTLLALALLIPLSLIVINLGDPPLKPEVLKILNEPAPEVSEAARHAYEFMLGARAGERTDPERRGAELLSHLDEPGVLDASTVETVSQRWSSVDFAGCGEPRGACGVEDLSPANDAVLEANRGALDLYVRLMEYGDFAALGRPAGGRIFDPVGAPQPALHRLFTLRLARWLKDGGEARAWPLLESSNRFYAAVLRRGGSLLDRMIALIALQTNAQVIAREVARRPKWTPPAELIESLDLPDMTDILSATLADEVRVVNAMVESLSSTWQRVLLRPHETVNVHYEALSQIFFTDCPRATPECVPALGYVEADGARAYLVNQVGHQLLRGVTSIGNSRDKMRQRLDDLLNLKAKLRAR